MKRPARGMAAGLRRRLLVLLIGPLLLLACLNAWFDWRSAYSVAERQDERLVALVPLLADSVISAGSGANDPPVLLLAPAVEEFLKDRPGYSAYALRDTHGRLLRGDEWLDLPVPATDGPEFHSHDQLGVTWRVVAQRQATVAGELVVLVADGLDPRQQWARAVLLTVLLPNLILVAAAALAVRVGVARALRPLMALKEAVERRSPRDLSALDESASPEETRPLVSALNRLFRMVNEQAQSQRGFIADAAHQLRTPLAGLQAQVEAWAQAPAASLDGTIVLPREEVERLRAATRRTSQLAHQLLALSRADARAMQGQPMHPVALRPLAESILEAHFEAASAKDIDLGLDAQDAEVPGHEWLLRELMSNLVDNAIRYTQRGGTVTLRCGRRDGAAFLEVEDDGPGVPQQERTRVVERFYRVPGTGGEGAGLGLAIAEEIARVHHSHLQLEEGALGRGLRVSVRLG